MAPASERRLRAMGGRAKVMVIGSDHLAGLAMERILDLEGLWSRFVASSDTSRANDRAGTPTEVSRETIQLFTRARQATVMTEGRFDPLLGLALAQLGYDRSFDTIGSGRSSAAVMPRPGGESACLGIDVERRTVTVPEGMAFDPGGIGKGLAGDLVVEETMEAGARGVLVDLGGDVRVDGESPHALGWPIGVEDPRTEGDVLVHLLLADGAVASSSRLRRTWTAGEQTHHHLLDPADGSPTSNGVMGVTVLAGSGWEAEALTKAAFVAGAEAVDVIGAHGAEGVVVHDDGTCCWTSGLSPEVP